jgi:hypothetical protein
MYLISLPLAKEGVLKLSFDEQHYISVPCTYTVYYRLISLPKKIINFPRSTKSLNYFIVSIITKHSDSTDFYSHVSCTGFNHFLLLPARVTHHSDKFSHKDFELFASGKYDKNPSIDFWEDFMGRGTYSVCLKRKHVIPLAQG